MNPVYYARELRDGLIGITEKHHPTQMHGVMMYLVIGAEKAALVDSGFWCNRYTPHFCRVSHGYRIFS